MNQITLVSTYGAAGLRAASRVVPAFRAGH
jgi:hypothetical protein